MKDVPEVLNTIVDKVLAYRPKPKSKAAKKRKRQQNKVTSERVKRHDGIADYDGGG
jgi:hypothetical protein